MIRYLSRITATWQLIVGAANCHVDTHTVQALQGRCPSGSTEDRQYIETQMKEGGIFPGVESRSGRSQILKNITAVPYIITSFSTFFEDVKCLEPCSMLLRDILPSDLGYSISQSLNLIHNGQTEFIDELFGQSVSFKVESSSSVARWKAYPSLWLFVLRCVIIMNSHTPWVNRDELAQAQDASLWRSKMDLAQFAVDCGYSTIRPAFAGLDAVDERAVKQFLRHIRPPELYHSADHELSDQIKSVRTIVQSIAPRKYSVGTPELSSDCDDLGPHYGVNCLSYAHVYDGFVSSIPQRHPTSYGRWRDFFQRFFGTPEDVPDQEAETSMSGKDSCSLLFHGENKCSREASAETSLGEPQTLLAGEESPVRDTSIPNGTCTHDTERPRKRRKI